MNGDANICGCRCLSCRKTDGSGGKTIWLPVVLLCDTNRILTSDYSEVKIVGAGADAVDFALINLCRSGDVVVTQDYGVAAMVLGKCAFAIHQDGWQYTETNIDRRASAFNFPS